MERCSKHSDLANSISHSEIRSQVHLQFVKDFGALSFHGTSLMCLCPKLSHHSACLKGFEHCSTSQLKLLSSSMVYTA